MLCSALVEDSCSILWINDFKTSYLSHFLNNFQGWVFLCRKSFCASFFLQTLLKLRSRDIKETNVCHFTISYSPWYGVFINLLYHRIQYYIQTIHLRNRFHTANTERLYSLLIEQPIMVCMQQEVVIVGKDMAFLKDLSSQEEGVKQQLMFPLAMLPLTAEADSLDSSNLLL